MLIKEIFEKMVKNEKVLFTNSLSENYISEICGIEKDSNKTYIILDDNDNAYSTNSVFEYSTLE